MKKVQIHVSKEDKMKPIIVLTGAHDKVCKIENNCIQHWLFKDIDYREFKVQLKHNWNPHKFNLTNKSVNQIQNNFNTLGSHQKGPCIVEHFNTIALQFQIRNATP